MNEDEITQIMEPLGEGLPKDLEEKTTEPTLPLPPLPAPSRENKARAMAEKAVGFAKDNPGKVLTTTALFIVAGVALTGGPNDPKGEPPHVQVAISEVMKTPVRFSGGPFKQKAERKQTVFGESVIYESIPQEATCLVVFEERIVKGDARRPALSFPVWWMALGSVPERLSEPSTGGFSTWLATFQGNGCLAIADRERFIGSDIHQLILHPKGRTLLLQQAKDGVKDAKGTAVHAVPFLDAQSEPDERVWFPHSLSGRDDLNFAEADGIHPRKRKEQ